MTFITRIARITAENPLPIHNAQDARPSTDVMVAIAKVWPAARFFARCATVAVMDVTQSFGLKGTTGPVRPLSLVGNEPL